MERKYKMVFLLVLLCLSCTTKAYSQKCLTMEYDENGNRVSFVLHHCGIDFELQDMKRVGNDEIDDPGIQIYPNPNDGFFSVVVDNIAEAVGEVATVQVYNNNGVLIVNECVEKECVVDISAYSPGIYLLRVVKDKYVFSQIVVKI